MKGTRLLLELPLLSILKTTLEEVKHQNKHNCKTTANEIVAELLL